jgi:hypothetical protein
MFVPEDVADAHGNPRVRYASKEKLLHKRTRCRWIGEMADTDIHSPRLKSQLAQAD